MSILSRKDIIIRILEGERQLSYDKKTLEEIKKFQKELMEEKPEYDDPEKLIEDATKKFEALYSDFLNNPDNFKDRVKKIKAIAKKTSKIPQKDKRYKSENGTLPILIDDFNIKYLQQANYDLRFGKEVYTTDLKESRILREGETVKINSGAFGAFLSYEDIYIPDDLLGLISLKSKFKMKGLVNVSGFHVDPGYHGKILFSVYNAGPRDITLRCGDPVFMIMFDKLNEPVLLGYDASKGYDAGYRNVPVDLITNLSGAPVSLRDLHSKYERLNLYVTLIWALIIAIVIGRITKIL